MLTQVESDKKKKVISQRNANLKKQMTQLINERRDKYETNPRCVIAESNRRNVMRNKAVILEEINKLKKVEQNKSINRITLIRKDIVRSLANRINKKNQQSKKIL